MKTRSEILGYAPAADAVSGERYKPVWSVLYCGLGAAGVTLLFVLAFVVTSVMEFRAALPYLSVGFLLVLVGGLLTTGLALVAFVEVVVACFYPVDRVRGIRSAMLVFVGVLLNYAMVYIAWVIGADT